MLTYGELREAVARMMSRTDLTAEMPRFCRLVEARMNRTVRAPQMNKWADIVMTGRYHPLPADWLEGKRVVFKIDGRRFAPDYATPYATAAKDTPQGTPRMYSINGNFLEAIPEPSAAGLEVELNYWFRIPSIAGNDSATNWVLFDAPDLYLYGMAAEAAIFVQDDKRTQQYNDRYGLAFNELRHYSKRHSKAGALIGRAL